MSNILITNSEVNSGNSIDLNASGLKTKLPVYFKAHKTPNDPTESYNNRLPTGSNTGIGGPQHTVNFVYDLDDSHATGAEASIDYEHLLDLALNSDQVCTLKSDKLVTTSNTTGEVNVMLSDITIDFSTTNIVSGSLLFTEVKS